MKGGLAAALLSIGALAAVLVVMVRKGPLVGLVILLAMALAVFGISVIGAFVGKKRGAGPRNGNRDG